MSKHKTIIKGSIRRKMYDADIYNCGVNLMKPKIVERESVVERQIIWNGELDYVPKLYDKIYIDELDLEVKIIDIIKTTNGIIYHSDYTIELIEDCVSLESKLEAEKKYNVLIKRMKEKDNNNKGNKFFENFFNFLFNKPIK